MLESNMEQTEDADCVKTCTTLVVDQVDLPPTAPVGKLKKTWQNTVSVDMHLLKTVARDFNDRMKCRTE